MACGLILLRSTVEDAAIGAGRFTVLPLATGDPNPMGLFPAAATTVGTGPFPTVTVCGGLTPLLTGAAKGALLREFKVGGVSDDETPGLEAMGIAPTVLVSPKAVVAAGLATGADVEAGAGVERTGLASDETTSLWADFALHCAAWGNVRVTFSRQYA